MNIKKYVPFVVLLVIVVMFFWQFLFLHLFPIPSDTIVGLYNPYRDFYAKEFPRGIPFKNFLITDPVRQQYPWRYESIQQIRQLQLPLWNPYVLSGTPLLGNGQSAPFSIGNLLFFISPFPIAWSMLIFLQPLFAGIFLYLYLKNLKIHTIPALLGSVSFAFSGFMIAWLEWGTIDIAALWLPLILLSIDKAFVSDKKGMWWGLYFLCLIFSFLAGHLQTFFYVFLLSHTYFLLQWVRSRNWSHLAWGIPLGILTLILVSVQLVPLAQFILLSARNSDLIIGPGWLFPWQHLITFIIPDFFGNPTTLNYWGVWNYAELAGYIGIPALLFALFALLNIKNKRIWFFAGVTVVTFLCMLPTPLSSLILSLHVPFLSTAQPTRLLILVDFSLVVLAAFGFDNFLHSSKKIYIPLVLFLLFFFFVWSIAFLHLPFMPIIPMEFIAVVKHNLIFPTVVFFVLATLLIVGSVIRKHNTILMLIGICVFTLSTFDNLRFANKFTPFTKPEYLFPSTKTVEFLQLHTGNFRIMTTDSRIFPPNFSVMYHIASIDGYDPLYIKEYGQLIAALGRGKPDISEPFGFNRILTPHRYDDPLVDLLGVKYVLSLDELVNTKYRKVFEEGQTKVYENTGVFPRAFFVSQIIAEESKQKTIDDMFVMSRKLQNVAIVMGSIDADNFLTEDSNVSILHYTANKVVLQTDNSHAGFLVLTDSFYPTWHAYIDKREVKIYPTDLAFRGVFVPEGKHEIIFANTLF